MSEQPSGAGQPGQVSAGVNVAVDTRGAGVMGVQQQALADLTSAGVPAALAAEDARLWGQAAESEAAIRLGWLRAPLSSRPLLDEIGELAARARADGLDHIVLAGMGGSSLAPEVITRTAGAELTVLDTTDPHQVAAVLADRLDRSLLVVSSKSGSTVETDSHRRIYEAAFAGIGLSGADLARRFVVVTDPGSPLEASARQAGYHVVLADPNVGGRYSALTAFGLVPSGLAGADIGALLDDAQAALPELPLAVDNPGLALGAALGGYAVAGHDKVVLADCGSGITGFGDWAEQLIAESTGKQGRGILPVVVGGEDSPGFSPGPGLHLIGLGRPSASPVDTVVAGPLGAQFLIWEYAVAVAGRLLGINPFDQPNVAESKENTQKLLASSPSGPLPAGEPAFTDEAVQVFADPELLRGATDLAGVLDAVLWSLPADGYLAIMAYLDRHTDQADRLRDGLAARTTRPVTFGWGPRFLHSTGQYHKGGPQTGVFLQLTGAVREDVQVPGQPFTLGRLQLAQALGDLGALRGRGRPAVRLHLLDRAAGIAQLLAAAGTTATGDQA